MKLGSSSIKSSNPIQGKIKNTFTQKTHLFRPSELIIFNIKCDTSLQLCTSQGIVIHTAWEWAGNMFLYNSVLVDTFQIILLRIIMSEI